MWLAPGAEAAELLAPPLVASSTAPDMREPPADWYMAVGLAGASRRCDPPVVLAALPLAGRGAPTPTEPLPVEREPGLGIGIDDG